MKRVKLLFCLLLVLGLCHILSFRAWAVPNLQIYIDGATYDTATETWVYPGLEYDLWAIGADPEATGPEYIYTVKLAAAVKTGQSGSINITPYLAEGVLAGSPISGGDILFFFR